MDIERINNLLDRKQQNIEKIEILVNEVSMLYKTRPKAGNQKVVDLILQQLTLLVNSNFVLPQKVKFCFYKDINYVKRVVYN